MGSSLLDKWRGKLFQQLHRPASSCRSGPSDIPSGVQDRDASLLSACSLTTASLISIMGFHSYKNLYQLPLCLHVAVSLACCWLTRSHWQNAFKYISCLAFASWFQTESCINANSWNRSVLQAGFMPYHWMEQRLQRENFSMPTESSLLCL